MIVAGIITPFQLGFDGLLLYRDYRNPAEDATGYMGQGAREPQTGLATDAHGWTRIEPRLFLFAFIRVHPWPNLFLQNRCILKSAGMPTPRRKVFNRSFWQSLVAVLVGNAIYYGIYRYLPPRGQHQLYRIDWGLAVDFWICVICYFLVRLIP